ncbi:MAG: NAD(P)-dependent oxidoreductase [Chloroflexota bacterium]|nr:NAD(P)-dependent oxidoreductase [Chloroflexota bacterium]
MATLLTGANGWVPSYIMRRIVQRGERVISFDLMPPDQMLRDFLDDCFSSVTFIQGDVTNQQQMLDIARRADVTRIVHAAAITPRVDREREEPQRIIDVNLGGTINALEVARQLPDFERFVYICSIAAVGGGHDVEMVDEETPSSATNLYGITKHTSERIALRYKDLFGLDVVSMRPASVYGPMERITPGYRGATELREMLRILHAGEELRVNSFEGPYHAWTFVEDVAEAVERAWATRNLPNDIYTITAGQQYSIGDMLAAFKRAWPEIAYRVVPEAEVNYHVDGNPPGPRTSNERMQQDFGWVPSTPLDDGVQQYIDWIRTNGPQ